MFIVDAGFFAYSYISVTNAVREGARCGAVGGTDGSHRTARRGTDGGLANSCSVDPPSTRARTSATTSLSRPTTHTAGSRRWASFPGYRLDDIDYTKSVTMRMETTPPYTKDPCNALVAPGGG